LILLAQVYLSLEDFENADRALDQAEKSLGPEPGLQMSYCRQRACSLAR
jgi:cytochrome c-type biogenesis protein CcmH/NrfG